MNTTELMSPQEVADFLRVPLSTVYGWRFKGVGPHGYRIGRHVRYRRAEVHTWLEEQRDAPRHPDAA